MLLPMFAFRAGHVSNDALVACCAAAATLGFVRLLREPFAWRVAWWTSAAVGLAYLSKISAIALVPPFALALARRRSAGAVADARLAPVRAGPGRRPRRAVVDPQRRALRRSVRQRGDAPRRRAHHHRPFAVLGLLPQRLPADADQVVHRRVRLAQRADAASSPTGPTSRSSRSASAARARALAASPRLAARGRPRRHRARGAGDRRPHQPAVHAAAGPLSAARLAGLRRPDRAGPARAAAAARARRVADGRRHGAPRRQPLRARRRRAAGLLPGADPHARFRRAGDGADASSATSRCSTATATGSSPARRRSG